MHRFLPIIFVIVFVSVVGCERVDQAFETLEKAKALKSDIEKTADQVKKDLTDKAEEIKNKALKEVGAMPDENQKGEKRPGDAEKEKLPAGRLGNRE